MASADTIFPPLQSKDLFFIHIKIFQYLNQDQDIKAYRLVSKGWRDFIDSHILQSPAWRKKFLQHPLGVPPEQRRPLIRTQLRDYRAFLCCCTVFERGQYIFASGLQKPQKLYVFTKTNVALKLIGHLELPYRKSLEYSRQQKNAFAMTKEHLFQLTPSSPLPLSSHRKPNLCAPNRLRSFKKQDETWIGCQHPARELWEQEGMEILGMRQLSESKVLLLVFNEAEGLLQAINLPDGTIQLTTKSIMTKEDCILNRLCASFGTESPVFDMDAFGLVIHGNKGHLQHFSFVNEDQTWLIVLEFNGQYKRITKARKVTILYDQRPKRLMILDNASGAVTYRRQEEYFSHAAWIHIEREMLASDDYLFLGDSCSHQSLNLEVFNISENRMMFFPVTVPNITLEDNCYIEVLKIAKQSETKVLYTLRIRGSQHQVLWMGMAWLDLKQPERMIVLSCPNDKGMFIACVPSEHGFFAINHQCTKVPNPHFPPNGHRFYRYISCCTLEGWKY